VKCKTISLIIDSDIEYIPLIGPIVNKLCSTISFSNSDSYKIELCVVEAVTNCIKHAYNNSRGHNIEIIFEIYPKELIIRVCSYGKKMGKKEQNFLKAEKVEFEDIDDINKIPDSGRGLMIIKSIMDHVTYESKEGKNCLVMIKKLPFP